MSCYAISLRALSLWIILLSISQLHAQKSPAKIGKLDKKEYQVDLSTIDSSAHAVYIFDYGHASMMYDQNTDKGFQSHFEHHYRIKILDDSGLEWSNIEIPLYKNEFGEEKLTSYKAYTYNEVDGDIERIKLENSDVFEEEIDRNRTTVKFAMPNAKVGSVIEIKYRVVSDFLYNFVPWRFQRSVPVLHSEYEVSIPEYFIYNTAFKGYEFGQVETNTSDKKPGAIFLRSGGSSGKVDYVAQTYHWVYKDVPAFKSEAYITTAKNYLGRVEFELARTNFPFALNKNYNTTWEAIGVSLMKNDEFGGQLKHENLFQEQVDAIIAGATTELEKAVAIYELAKRTIQWNKEHRIYATENLRRVLKEGKGSSADVNLSLINMLNAGGLRAYPVLVSTRNHGYINVFMPSLNQFNHVIAAIKLDDQYLTLDATDPLTAATMLPAACLNGKGRLIAGSGSAWIDLRAREPYKIAAQATLQVQDDGTIHGEVRSSLEGYAAQELRRKIGGSDSETKYQEQAAEEDDLEVTDVSFENLANIYENLLATFKVHVTEQAMSAGDMLYISPMFSYGLEENPFKLEERKYPVDYGMPIEELYILVYEMPEGYAIEELPEDLIINLPDKAARFTYSVKEMAGKIQVLNRLQINKTLFLPDEYKSLKEFYNLIIEKQGEQMVLKKKT